MLMRSLHPDQDQLEALAERVSRARTVTPGLASDVIGRACACFAAPENTQKASRICRFIEAGAWVDATLALIALELPDWCIRVDARQSGEWRCELGHGPGVVEWLDDTVVTQHEELALALLAAFIKARRLNLLPAEGQARVETRAGRSQTHDGTIVCCDNFG